MGHVSPGQPTTGVLIEVPHYTVAFIERVLADVLESYDPSDDKQSLISAVIAGIPTHGEVLIEKWRSKAAVYPPELALAMIQRHAQIDHFWRTEMFLERGDNLPLLYDTFVQVAKKLFYMLLALNHTYYSGFKWIHLLLAGMPLKAADFEARLKRVFEVEPRAAAREMRSLVEETYTLVEQTMPTVDAERLRQIFRYERQPWDRMPGGIT
jgi:hypothetical protein